jgi:hypothetical protein
MLLQRIHFAGASTASQRNIRDTNRDAAASETSRLEGRRNPNNVREQEKVQIKTNVNGDYSIFQIHNESHMGTVGHKKQVTCIFLFSKTGFTF